MRIDYKRSHEGLWNWLAKNPKKRKRDWPGWKTMEKYEIPIPINHCFACEYSDGYVADCNKCPVWFNTQQLSYYCTCELESSYYYMWKASFNNKDRSKYAKLIARGWK
jgi:hypothetical protein